MAVLPSLRSVLEELGFMEDALPEFYPLLTMPEMDETGPEMDEIEKWI